MIEKIQWIMILEEINKYKMVNDESVESVEILKWYSILSVKIKEQK